MLSSGSGKKKEIIIDKESVKKGTSEAKALFKKIANEIIPGVIKQELKTEKYKGEQGLPGKDGTNGKDGLPGKDGVDGLNGKDGKDGLNGKHGLPCKNGVDGKNGLNGVDGTNGTNGLNGKDGEPGKDGINGLNGTNGLNGKDGKDGLNGKNGVDSPFCKFLSIKPIDNAATGESKNIIFQQNFVNETLNPLTVNIKVTGEGDKKGIYLFADRDYDFMYKMGKYELIGRPIETKAKSNNAKLLSNLNLQITNNDIKIFASGLADKTVNYYGVVTIIGGTFKD